MKDETISYIRHVNEWRRIRDILMIASEIIEEEHPRLSFLIKDIAKDFGGNKVDEK